MLLVLQEYLNISENYVCVILSWVQSIIFMCMTMKFKVIQQLSEFYFLKQLNHFTHFNLTCRSQGTQPMRDIITK